MTIRSGFLALMLCFLTVALYAQREETVLGERGWGLSGFWGGYKHQYTRFGDNNDVFTRGGFFGFEFGKSLYLGWGRYDLQDEFDWDGADGRRFDIRWNVGKLGYAFAPYKAIHPMINLDLGRGKVNLQGVGEDRLFIIQPSAGVEINVFRWFRLGLEGGYRFVNDTDLAPLSDKDLSGVYGQASLKFGFSWGRMHKRDRNYQKNRERDRYRDREDD
jgi:hypothetical protein